MTSDESLQFLEHLRRNDHLVASATAGGQPIEQGGLRVNDDRITDPKAIVPVSPTGVFQVRSGKKRLIGRLRPAP